jgi:nicotinamide mononucleotide transporter
LELNWLEVFGFVTGAVCVWLQVKEKIWGWPIGITNNLVYIVVFLTAKLYADMGLQVVYILISVYGWWNWLHPAPGTRKAMIRRLRLLEGVAITLAIVSGAAFLRWLLSHYTDSTVPFWDGTTTAISLAAQYMLGRKHLENWLVWIGVDVVYIGLYIYKHLYLTSFLYFIFLLMCVAGYAQWKKALRQQSERATAAYV